MKSTKYCVPMLLLCVLLANLVKQSDSGAISKDAAIETLSYMSSIIDKLPMGSFGSWLTGGLGLLQLSAKIFTGDEQEPLTKPDFLESQAKIAHAIENVNTQVQESTRILTHEIQSNEMLEDMRNDLDTLRDAFDESMQVILNPKITGKTRTSIMDEMLNTFSDFRKLLRSFVSRYIKQGRVVSAQGRVKLFFEFILNKESIEMDGGNYCHSDSTHSKLFKSYIYIFKTLTDAYVMAVSAHTMHYQSELLKEDTENANANATQAFGISLLNQYKANMKQLMAKARWAMDKASRVIRNCGTFELKRGETFESISFAHILPKFKYVNFDPFRPYCKSLEEDVKLDDYEIIHDQCTDGGVERAINKNLLNGVIIYSYTNSTNSNWPYLFLKTQSRRNKETFFGHSKPETDLRPRVFATNNKCYSLFCPVFKKNVAICTQIIRAEPGNVITGVHFTIRENVICLDIQQGKLVNDLLVDPETVTWTETPKSNDKIYLTSEIRKLELGVVELKEKDYLTAIQFELKNDGIIGFVVGGGRASNWTTSGPLTGSSYSDKSNELILSECDNPEQFGGVKNMISKPPVPSKPYHIKMQPSDFKKDFGITTIPNFDMRKVYTNPSAPLGGFGISHRTVNGSGGFVSLELLSPNYSHFIDEKVIEAIDTTVKV